MTSRVRHAILVLALAIVAGAAGPGCGGSHERPSLVLFVAASLTDAMQQVGDAYAASRSVEISYNFAASGALARQLLAAPRGDLFLSASERWMDVVQEGGRIVEGSRRTLLSNSLVVIANPGSDLPAGPPSFLCAPGFAYLAVGDPESVPAGRYAREWLESLPCPDGGHAWDAVVGRVSPAPDVRAALTQVEGRVDVVGIVYRTDWLARRDGVRLLYEVPEGEGPPIRYPVARIRRSRSSPVARDFLDFLEGARARAMFEKHGFRVADRGPARGRTSPRRP